MIRKIMFAAIILYSCSFVSASAIEKLNIKALPLFLLLGVTQVFDAMAKPLTPNISSISTNTTTNVTSEILQQSYAYYIASLVVNILISFNVIIIFSIVPLLCILALSRHWPNYYRNYRSNLIFL
jgi:hypothetical protein